MIAKFRDFICKIQVKIQKPPLVYTSLSPPPPTPFFIFPSFLDKVILSPPPRFPILES